MRGCVFLGWTSTKQGFMCLDQGYMQCSRWGSNLQPLNLKSNTLPLMHCAPCNSLVFHWLLTLLEPNFRKKSGHLFSWTMLKNIYTSWKHPCVLYIPPNYCTSLTLYIVRDFPIQIDMIWMEFFIIYFKRSKVGISIQWCISLMSFYLKQCRTWWNAALCCCISSGSSLFVKVCF